MTSNLASWQESPGGAGCCPVSGLAETAAETVSYAANDIPSRSNVADPEAFVETATDGLHSLHLMVENLACAACIRKIERAVLALPGVNTARVNMSTRRMSVTWTDKSPVGTALGIVETVTALGYPVAPFSPTKLGQTEDRFHFQLLSAMAVAGFAAGNVMLLSVAVWAGAFADMGETTRALFHWVSALIALPAIAYAGRPFFESAWRVLRSGHVNMDVPISLAVLLAAGASLYQTFEGGPHAYFDASISLLFFLLIGRYLDVRARRQARTTAEHLMALNAVGAIVIDDQGREQAVPPDQLKPGMVLLVRAGQRIAADGIVSLGQSEVDCSLVTGETLPVRVAPGERVYAGTLNVGNPVRVTVRAVAENTLLGEIVRLVETAEQGRARYVRIAERASRIYVPVVHSIAAVSFVGWLWLAAAGWEQALMIAVTVLIITCPCALALAVPVVQVVATGALLKRGLLVKTADGLERLAECDYVVFDKTGTLTRGRISLLPSPDVTPATLDLVAALAGHSHHPLCRAIVTASQARVRGDALATTSATEITGVEELPGRGLSAACNGKRLRLGRADWVFAPLCEQPPPRPGGQLETWFWQEGCAPQRLVFSDQTRDDAGAVVAALKARNFGVELLSGDRAEVTRQVANETGITRWTAGMLPGEKVERIKALSQQGHRVLMVGDGLNDAPALACGHASLSPASAADITQTAADLVFQGERLSAVLTALDTARRSDRIVRQNFAVALAYNLCAVPVAVAGLATPLVAAIAMSSSSLLVTFNALRLKHIAPAAGARSWKS